jgi:hypothetical protein
MTMKNLIILLSCFCFCFCSRQKPTEIKRLSQIERSHNSFFSIKYEDILNSKEVIKLSQIATNVEYVQLESGKDCMLGKGLLRYFFTDEFIFVQDFDHIMEFSRKGKFIKRIGTPGTESGQIDIISTTSILPNEELICVQTSRRKELLFYTFKGKLIKSLTLKRWTSNVKILTEDRFINFDLGSSGKNKFNFTLVNGKMDTISSVKNYNSFEIPQERRLGRGYPLFDPFCSSNNYTYLKAMFNDTVYSVVSDKIEPDYFVDLGKYKFPDSLMLALFDREGGRILENILSNYYYSNVFQTAGKIFISAYSYNDAPSKCVFFDIKTQQGKMLINDKDVSKGFINDWDGGLDFWPKGLISDNQLFMPIRIADIKNHLSRISTSTSVKFPDKMQKLSNIITKSDILSNPVIMIISMSPDM